jgi:sortase family protein
VVWLARPDDDERASGTSGQGTQTSEATSSSPSGRSSSAPATCAVVKHAFRPRRITVPGVTRDAVVVAPPREADGVPGAPPLTSSGKTEFAWDREQGIRPGDSAGNVLLNAHTWPDGSAVGNRLLATLHRGDRIVVRGDTERLCYRVTERVEVLATRGLKRYYTRDGPPQLALVVCSGRRLGPGVWTKRTVWFASPAA